MKFFYFALVVLAVIGCALSSDNSNSDPERPARCLLPIKPGPCLAYGVRYGYNAETNKCERFIYGGCQGNENQFGTLVGCRVTCKAGK